MKVRVSFTVDIDEWRYKDWHLLDTNAEARQSIQKISESLALEWLSYEGVLK